MGLPDEQAAIDAADWGATPPSVYQTPYRGRVPGCYIRVSVTREQIEAAAFGPRPDPVDLDRLADDGGPPE